MTTLATALALILVTGDLPIMTQTNAGADPCGARGLAHLIGAAVPGAEALAALAVPGRIRVIGPQDRVTMDLLPDRLNILVDEAGIVTGLRCG